MPNGVYTTILIFPKHIALNILYLLYTKIIIFLFYI